MTRTPEGYLRGQAVVSRTGVFEYNLADGNKLLQLRHPDDVFKADSTDTLRQIPVTMNHPPELVNADNAKRYQVGHTGDAVERNAQGHIIVGFTITDANAVKQVEAGVTQQLSLGYTLDLIAEEGVYQGQPYTHRQTNIRYNHLALVSQARAGDVATINLDGTLHFVTAKKEATMATDSTRLVTVNLDGINYDASPEVAKHLERLQSENLDGKKSLDELKKQMDELKGQLDAVKAEYDEMKGKTAEKEKNADSVIAQAVTDRLALIAKAGKLANTDGMEAMTSRDIMVKAIQAKRKDFNADGKSDEYVQGQFDALLEMKDSVPPSVASQLAGGATANADAVKPKSLMDAWLSSVSVQNK